LNHLVDAGLRVQPLIGVAVPEASQDVPHLLQCLVGRVSDHSNGHPGQVGRGVDRGCCRIGLQRDHGHIVPDHIV
jgi:hypothetical protein